MPISSFEIQTLAHRKPELFFDWGIVQSVKGDHSIDAVVQMIANRIDKQVDSIANEMKVSKQELSSERLVEQGLVMTLYSWICLHGDRVMLSV